MADSKILKINLYIDNKNKKVIFAESDKDFVDVLFSFLTMPLGSVIRILKKQSSLGCMDKLYESVEDLDDCYFCTKACKEMLLSPLNASGEQCEDLILRLDESNPRNFFSCKNHECRSEFPFFSLVPKSTCRFCGEIMNYVWYWKKYEHRGPNGDGVFVGGMVKFMITDDLRVMPASTTNMHKVIGNIGINDFGDIGETSFDLDVKMLQELLKRSLTSKSPITDVYFEKTDIIENRQLHSLLFPKAEDIDIDEDSEKLKAKLITCKSSNKVLYIEAEEGFVDFLFSFLTFPMGYIVKLLNTSSSINCMDNLYKSVEGMNSNIKYIKLDALKLLLEPKLAAHFGHNNSLFSQSEKDIRSLTLPGCHSCFMDKICRVGTECLHGVKHVSRTEMNPKLSSDQIGGSYAKKKAKFLITDDLHIKPFSTHCSFLIMQKHNVSVAGVKEEEICIDEHDALKILKACLNSQTPLSYVFMRQRSEVYFDTT